MNTVAISPSAAQRMYQAAAYIHSTLATIPVPDPRQHEMDLGHEQAVDEFMAEREVHLQAIDAFMDERDGFKAHITDLYGVTSRQQELIRSLIAERDSLKDGPAALGAENADLRAENDAMSQTIHHVAGWNASLRDKLSRMGIAIDTDAIGEPVLSVQLSTMLAAADRMLGV